MRLLDRSANALIINNNDEYFFYIIKSGHENIYFVIEDNPYMDETFGNCEILTKEQILEKYEIEIPIAK